MWPNFMFWPIDVLELKRGGSTPARTPVRKPTPQTKTQPLRQRRVGAATGSARARPCLLSRNLRTPAYQKGQGRRPRQGNCRVRCLPSLGGCREEEGRKYPGEDAGAETDSTDEDTAAPTKKGWRRNRKCKGKTMLAVEESEDTGLPKRPRQTTPARKLPGTLLA